jgi:hypothetical protein
MDERTAYGFLVVFLTCVESFFAIPESFDIFIDVSDDMDFIDVSCFIPVSADGAGAIAGADVDVEVESVVVVLVSFALQATIASAAATRAKRFIYRSPDRGVRCGIGRKLRAPTRVSRPVR